MARSAVPSTSPTLRKAGFAVNVKLRSTRVCAITAPYGPWPPMLPSQSFPIALASGWILLQTLGDLFNGILLA